MAKKRGIGVTRSVVESCAVAEGVVECKKCGKVLNNSSLWVVTEDDGIHTVCEECYGKKIPRD